jgi:pyruvate kinase
LIEAGVNVFRLNSSHGTHAEFKEMIKNVRSASSELRAPVCILQDLQGPKIRVGDIPGGQLTLHPGQSLTLTDIPDTNSIFINYPNFAEYTDIGNRILLDDGAIELSVIDKSKHKIHTNVEVGGILKSHKGVNLPGSNLRSASPTEKDITDLAFGLEQNVDVIALSFVYSADDVERLRREIIRLKSGMVDIPIIAKLERPEALDNLETIISAANGVMVARGDLGIEMSPEAVPIAQKRIIAAANQHAKMVITATQMLESMIHNPRPTRAESTDVANAIFDGTDAVMLSAETAIGEYPVKSVEVMHKIICQAEDHLTEWGHWEGGLIDTLQQKSGQKIEPHDDALSITQAAKQLAHDRNVTAIAVFTQSGRTATLMSKARPAVPILAFTPIPETYNRLALLWGVTPYSVPFTDTVEGMLKTVEKTILQTSELTSGQQIVLISGFPVGSMCPPNLALLHTLRPIS